MEKSQKIKLGISVGDINGIGIEIILKSFEDKRMLDFCTPVIFASSKLMSNYMKETDISVPFNGVKDVSNIIDGKLNVVQCWNETANIELGKATEEGGRYALKSLVAATDALNAEEVDVIVTAPINKDTIQSDEFKFPGHTEFLESKIKGKSLMILMKDTLRIGLITGHIPVSKIAESIHPQIIKEKVEIMYHSLKQDFAIDKPKIALLGLNPHCGDHGVIGKEDDEIIIPTVKEIQEEGKLVFGPYAADSFFGTENYKNFDGILAMYHDQGLAPFKTLAFGGGVNFTAGLEKVRTSPDHGTAYELAGKNKANINSFKEAVFAAIQVFNSREEYKNLTKNVLKIKAN